MSRLNIYLNFPGNAEEAFNFYKSVFGGEFASVMRWENNPGCGDMPSLTEEDKKRIMHIALPIGDGNVLMGSDWPGDFAGQLNPGNNFSVAYSAVSREDADRVFASLSADGKVNMPMDNMFWGSYWGSLTDKFGIQWMVDYAPSH
jgi:PhnB protein